MWTTLFVSISVLVNVCPSTTSTILSWTKLQISPTELCSMPFGSFRVNIYEHARNNKTDQSNNKFFYAPIALLDHKSAVSQFNNITTLTEIRFRIEMWNDIVESEVVKYLSKVVDHEVHPHQVQVIPFEKVVLVSTIPPKADSLTTNWLPFEFHKSLQFSLSCFEQNACDQLAEDMRSKPEHFNYLKLLFSWTCQTTETKDTVIRIENVISSQMVNKLMRRFSQDTKEVFLTANDERRLLVEITTNVLMETFQDSDIVSPNSEQVVYNSLNDLLFSSTATIKDQSEWELVFWNDDNYRPDKSSDTLNKIFEKINTEGQEKLRRLYQNPDNTDGGEAKFTELILDQANFTNELSRHGSTTKEGIEQFYRESKDHVIWSSDKFVPKRMSLNRFKLAQIRDQQSLPNRKVSVRYTTAALSIPLNFAQNADMTVTDEWQSLKLAVANLTKEPLLGKTKAEYIDHIPSSCDDLRRIGHTHSGLYSIMGAQTVESVYCNFTKLSSDADFQKSIGFVDVKSSPTYFFVQRKTKFGKKNIPIPFEVERLNTGGAMNLDTGKFTAPVSGTYFFSFSGVMVFGSTYQYINIGLYKNDELMGAGHSDESSQSEMLSLQSTLNLKRGDEIWLQIFSISTSGGGIRGDYFNNFNGFLLQENTFETHRNLTL